MSEPVSWELTRHQVEVGLAQLPAGSDVPRWAYAHVEDAPLWLVLRNADEVNVLCDWDDIPGTVPSVGPLIAYSVDGPLDHALTGVLAGLLEPLAQAGVSILAESSFDTDWILVPSPQADQAAAVWTAAGHQVDLAGAGEPA